MLFNINNGTFVSHLDSFNQVSSYTIAAITDNWYRISITSTLSITQIGVGLSNTSNPSSYTATRLPIFSGDGTSGIFIWGAQLVEGTSALDYFPTTDRLNVPRIDFRNADGTLSSCGRLLLEPQRTNSIRNSSMVGAVAGTPGTLPTNWIQVGSPGLTRTITGVGTENGLPYIDVRFNGTATIPAFSINTEQLTAAPSQVFANSAYLKNIANPNPANTIQLGTNFFNSGAFVNSQSTIVSITNDLTRFVGIHTASSSALNTAFTYVTFFLTVGAAYDFTIRIAAPQMELGSFASTWIPTTTAAVTRLADAASKTGISSLIGQTEGVLFWEGIVTQQTDIIAINRSTVNGVYITKGTGNLYRCSIYNSSNVITLNDTAVRTTNTKIALAYKSGDSALFVNGVKVATSAGSITFSGALSEIRLNDNYLIGIAPQSANQINVYGTRLTDAECIQLSTL